MYLLIFTVRVPSTNNFFQIPIVLQKEPDIDQYGKPTYDPDGKQRFKCGFKIGGGIDQDPAKSPQGYPDKVNKQNFTVHLDIFLCFSFLFTVILLGSLQLGTGRHNAFIQELPQLSSKIPHLLIFTCRLVILCDVYFGNNLRCLDEMNLPSFNLNHS